MTLGDRLPPDAATIAAADRAARHWTSPEAGPLVPGSEAHERATCRMFRDTFNPYKPSVIDWPKLDPEALARLVSLPIWDIAVQTEGKARLRMQAYAESLANAPMAEAIALNGWEESRHKEVLSRLVEAYGIRLAPEPEYRPPRDVEWAYLVTGFGECIDSFFAFGLFEMAKRSGYFPAELVETFEPVIQEECRHILLFANWLAWHRARLSPWRRPWFELRVAAAWCVLAWERIGIARGLDGDGKPTEEDHRFTITTGKALGGAGLGMAEVLELCLAENDRRFAGYDHRLRRPATTPFLARLARWVVGRRPGRDS